MGQSWYRGRKYQAKRAGARSGTTITSGSGLSAGAPMSQLLESRVHCSLTVPALSSAPQAPVKIYLDFDGDPARQWGGYNLPATPAFSQDADNLNFSTSELTSIAQIWARVSEKYSPFNVDVTTINPGTTVAGQAMQIVIGG